MSKSRTQNTLLVEIMISVLFFALCSTVILEVFVTAREYSRRSAVEGQAMISVRDTAEQVYGAEDAQLLLAEAGFEQTENGWVKAYSEYRLELVLQEEETAGGILRSGQICALREDKVIAEIPVVRYIPGGAAQ